jgi:hypothetical protein
MRALDESNNLSVFKIGIVIFAFAFFIISYLIEEFIVDRSWFKTLGKTIVRKKAPKNRYKIIQQEVKRDSQWPYIGRVTFDK